MSDGGSPRHLNIAVEANIKCELSDGGSPRHLNTFSNLFIVAVYTTHINTCYYCLLNHVHHVAKKLLILLLLLTAPI